MGVPSVGEGKGVRLAALVGLISGAAGVCVGKRAGSRVAVALGAEVAGEKGVKVGSKVGVTRKMDDESPPPPVPRGMARTQAVNKAVTSARKINRRSTEYSKFK
jgi:hypothetical protein